MRDGPDDLGRVPELIEAGLAVAFTTPPPPTLGQSVLGSLERIPGVVGPLLAGRPLESAGRYEIGYEIGRGGTGIVFAGRDRDLDREVALKVLRTDRVGSPGVVRRFLDEARIESRLEHPGIAPVYDAGLVRENLPYFAMALLRGHPLSALLAARSDPTDDQRRFLRIFEQVCQTVAHAHARGVIHRDLKPSNVIVGSYGEVYVLDWGLARVDAPPRETAPEPPHEPESLPAAPGEAGVSTEGAILGTPAYLPPEQARGDLARITERSDVFALGGVLLEILTGLPPHVGTTTDAVLRAARGDVSDALGRLAASGADPHLAALVASCLAADPAARPADAATVARAVGQHLAADEERSWRATVDAARDRLRREAEEGRERTQVRRAQRERQSRHRTLGIVGSLLLAFLLGAGFLLLRQASERIRTRAVTTAVEDALRQASRAEGARDAAAAEAWARRAVERARAGDAEPEVLDRARAALARATVALDEALAHVRDERLLARLDRIDDAFSAGQDRRASEAAYAQAFAERGVAPDETSPERIAETFRGSTARSDVAAALESWARLRKLRPGAAVREWRPLREAARRLAPDPWRERLLDAALAGDRPAFRAAALAAQDREIPRRTLHLISDLLTLREQQDLARPILLASWRRHPSDARLNELLCVAFGGWRSPVYLGGRADLSPAESLRFGLARVAVRPADPHGWMLLGTALDLAGDRAQAEAACRRALALDAPDPPRDHRAVLADVLAHQGRDEEAVREYVAALEGQPDDASLHLRLGGAYRRLGQLPQSLDVLDRGLRFHPTDALLLASRGETLVALGRDSDAERSFREAAERSPTLWPIWQHLGTLLRRQGRHAEAVAAHRQGLEAVPAQPSLLHNLGLLLLELGKPDEAAEQLRRCAEVRPEDPETLMGLANAYDMLGDTAKQEAALRRAIGIDSAHAGARTNLAWILLARDDVAGAEAELRIAVRLDPRLMEAWYTLGLVVRRAGRPDMAVAYLQNALALAPDDWQIHLLLGTLYCDDLHDYPAAVRHFRRVLGIRPGHQNAYVSLALALRRQGEHAQAAEALRLAVLVDPSAVRPHADLGQVLYLAGDWDGAASALRRALALDPRHVEAAVLLAWLRAVAPDPTGQGPEEALALLESVRAAASEDPRLPLVTGVALVRLRRQDEAVRLLEPFAAKDDAGACYALAAAYVGQGRSEEARALVARADATVAKDPPVPELEVAHLRSLARDALPKEGGR